VESVRRDLFLAALAVTLAACVSWHSQNQPVQQVVGERHPGSVRVTLTNGSRMVLAGGPRIVGDTLVGLRTDDGSGRQVKLPIADVRQVAIERFSAGRTAILLAGAAAIVALVAENSGSSGGSSGPSGSGGAPGFGGGEPGYGNSCPHVYSWDGAHWRIDSGTFGFAISHAGRRTDVDNLDRAVAEGDILRLRLVSELPETDHVDELTVLAVDHPRGTEVAPEMSGRLRVFRNAEAPLAAHDRSGDDVLARLLAEDGSSWVTEPAIRDTSWTEDLREGIVLTFARPRGAQRADLVIDATNTTAAAQLEGGYVRAHGRATQAWYDSLDALPLMARMQDALMEQEAGLGAWVLTAQAWQRQGSAWLAGPEAMKRHVVALDLSGVVGDTVLVRLESAAGFWRVDRVRLAEDVPDSVLQVAAVASEHAVIPGGLDVADLLARADERELVSEPGDVTELSYRVPPRRPGLSRSYLLRASGWYRIHVPAEGDPDVPLLALLGRQPYGLSRAAAVVMNRALVASGGAR